MWSWIVNRMAQPVPNHLSPILGSVSIGVLIHSQLIHFWICALLCNEAIRVDNSHRTADVARATYNHHYHHQRCETRQFWCIWVSGLWRRTSIRGNLAGWGCIMAAVIEPFMWDGCCMLSGDLPCDSRCAVTYVAFCCDFCGILTLGCNADLWPCQRLDGETVVGQYTARWFFIRIYIVVEGGRQWQR